MDRAGLIDTPAFVVSDLDEVLVQNRMSVAVMGERAALTGLDRNFTWRTAARRRGDADVESLVGRRCSTCSARR